MPSPIPASAPPKKGLAPTSPPSSAFPLPAYVTLPVLWFLPDARFISSTGNLACFQEPTFPHLSCASHCSPSRVNPILLLFWVCSWFRFFLCSLLLLRAASGESCKAVTCPSLSSTTRSLSCPCHRTTA